MRALTSFAAVALVALVAVLASCGSFGADDGEVPVTPADAGPDGTTSGDAALGDAGGESSFCPRPGALVCEDFEGAAGFRFAGWKKDDESGRNTIRVDDAAGAPSPRHALHLIAEAGAATASDAYVEAKTALASKASIEADVKVASGSGQRAVLLQIQRDGGGLSFRIRPNGEVEERIAEADGGLTPKTLGYLPMPPEGEWDRMALSVDLTAHAATATVGGMTKTYALDPAWVPVPLEARVGLTDADPNVRWEVFVDDVVVTAQ